MSILYSRSQYCYFLYKKNSRISGKEKVEYPNKYRIMGYDENKHEVSSFVRAFNSGLSAYSYIYLFFLLFSLCWAN